MWKQLKRHWRAIGQSDKNPPSTGPSLEFHPNPVGRSRTFASGRCNTCMMTCQCCSLPPPQSITRTQFDFRGSHSSGLGLGIERCIDLTRELILCPKDLCLPIGFSLYSLEIRNWKVPMKSILVGFSLFVSCSLFAAEPAAPSWNHNTGSPYGPANWGTVAPQFATCGSTVDEHFVEVGMRQTPVNIDTSTLTRTNLPALTFQYQNTPFDIENTGHVIEVPYTAGSFIRLGLPSPYGALGFPQQTDEWQLLQFHFHVPSEHTINGKQADMELHLVHVNQLGELAVVGVLMNQSTVANTIVDQIMSNSPAHEGDHSLEGQSVNARQLLPENLSYYMYSGSLTTPPCTEIVRWFVLTTPMPVSPYALQQMHHLVGMFPGHDGFENNNRAVVPLHGRTILANR